MSVIVAQNPSNDSIDVQLKGVSTRDGMVLAMDRRVLFVALLDKDGAVTALAYFLVACSCWYVMRCLMGMFL